MKILAEVFLVTYSILYGIMLNSCMSLNLFPFGRLFHSITALRRILASFVYINIAPFVVFSLIFRHIETANITSSAGSIFGLFLISIIMFAFYRLVQAIIAWNYEWLYDFYKERLSKDIKETIRFVKNSSPTGHMFSVFLYIVLFAIGWIMIHKIYPWNVG